MIRLLPLLVLLAGCVTTLDRAPLYEVPIERYQPPEVPISPPGEGHCTSATTLGPGEGRDCLSVSVPPGYLEALQEAVEILRKQAEPALAACYQGWQLDRGAGERALAGCREELAVCRRSRAEAWGMGFATGCGVCAGGAAAACAGATR